jgi:hypothetical protein
MARKPVDKLTADENRDAVWQAICDVKIFTISDIYSRISLSRDTIRDYVLGLEKAGILAREPVSTQIIGQSVIFRLIKTDRRIEAPRVRKDGTEVTQGRGRENMWAVMKALKTFTALDVAVTASNDQCAVALGEAKKYIQHLEKAGYLTLIQPGKPGGTKTPGQLARYLFIKNTGPKPPQIQRCTQVWDANLKQVVWTGGGS